jgi:lipopolysaccharide export system permease protein
MVRPVIPLLHRYIFSELLKVFALVLTVLTVLLVFVGVFQQATEQGLGPLQLLQVLPFIVPSMLPFTIPATLLLTISVVYGRIAGDQEIVAAKSAGINVMSLMMPAFFLGAVLSVASLLLTDQVIPWAWGNIQRTVISAVEEIFLDRLRTEHQLRYKPKGVDITVTDVVGRTLIHPVFRIQRSNGILTVEAEEAYVEFDLARQLAILRFRDGRVDMPTRDPEHVSRLTLTGEERLEIPLDMDDEQMKPRHLSIRQIDQELLILQDERRQFEERRQVEAAMALTLGHFDALTSRSFATSSAIAVGERRVDSLRTEFHSRFALACSCLFFVLLGTPFAVLGAKNQFLTSFLFCFGPIVGAYYPLVLGLMAQAKRGHVNPAGAMWIGNLLLLLVAVYFLRRVMRH